MSKLFKCSHCDIEFESTNYRKYCSKECSFDSGGWIIDEKTNCWNWSGRKSIDGYGMFYFREHIYAHRFSCECVHGPASKYKPLCLHSCDNPSCINPDHLRWGDNTDNMHDKRDRDRFNRKLDKEKVIEIKEKLKNYVWGSYSKLAKEYNVDIKIITGIHKGLKWKHI